ncbi:hypothetical protein WMY93_007166 [Mugilogobius chulae]|uniref:TFIIS N-terminal domain-containing protein n=1 Tax=Mugilogobius chulae TaxID=88201 RepID=A0AAW0PPJ8_9GOBI
MASCSDVVNKIIRYKLQLRNTEETAKILKTLKKLKSLEITLDVLAETGIGKTVNSLRRHELAGDLAKSLVRDWKRLVPKGSKSPSTDDKTTDELPWTNKSNKMVTNDCNNNNLTDEREEETPVSKKIKKEDNICKNHKGSNELKKQHNPTNDFLSKTKITKKKNILNRFHNESSDEILHKSHTSKNILSKRKSKSHKRKKYNHFSDDESDLSDSGSDKKSLKETKSKDHFCHEPTHKKPKFEHSPIRPSEAQCRKREKQDNQTHKEKSPVVKTKKTKNDEKAGNTDTDEPTMSFESYLNYDDNVSKRKERPKPKKLNPKSKPVVKKEVKKDVIIQPEEPLQEPSKCLPEPECSDSPLKVKGIPKLWLIRQNVCVCIFFFVQVSLEAVPKIAQSPPLESWFPEVETLNLKRKAAKEGDSFDILEESVIFTGQRFNKKMQVYSGAKTIFLPAMMSLYQQCIRTLQNNINCEQALCLCVANVFSWILYSCRLCLVLYETGGVPFEILEPVLQRCTPEQLLRIEEHNPIYIGETDHLWGKHCQRDFKDAKLQEYESWKEMYLRLSEERERKFKMLTKTISSAQSTRPKGRQVKMAFIHSVAKPPRDVRIKQEIHGTAVQQPLPSAEVAPIMAKSLKAFKKQFGRR